MKITNNTLIKHKKNVIYKTVDGVVYLLDPANGTIHTLNQTASFLWEFLDKPRTFKSIVDAIYQTFEVQRSKAIIDCRKFINSYEELGFIELKTPD